MKTPWHLWVIGLVSLLWNAGGAFDFVMTNMKSESYLAAFTPEQLGYFNSLPIWATVSWGIAVLGAVLGSVLLLMRSGNAVMVFAIAFLAMLLNLVYGNLIADVSLIEVMGSGAMWFTLAIFVVALLLVIYARAMRQKGVLR